MIAPSASGTERKRMGRPPVMPAPAPTGFAEISGKLDAILQQLGQQSTRAEAFDRFERSLPMTVEHVAAVLDTSAGAVHKKVHRGELKRRSSDRAGFHAEDVRAYLSGKRG
jgi:hypothetical protein